MDLLDLAEAPPAETKPKPDPWAWARAQFPDSDIVRVINLHRNEQSFLQIPRPRKVVPGREDDVLLTPDNGTVVLGLANLPIPREMDEARARVIAAADAAWAEHYA